MRKCPMTTFYLLSSHTWFLTALMVLIVPVSNLNAQDEGDYEDPTEVFWGDDEEEYTDDEEYYDEEDAFYEDDTSEYYDDDEYYDDESEYYDEEDFYEDDESGYYDDEEYSDDEGEYEEEDVTDTELADLATQMGYSLNISGASPGFVNHDLNTYNNNPQINFRLSVEFPLLMQVLGVRFRFGAEVGNFGFENYLPQGGKFSGITAMGLLAFPAGPGKLKIGAGLIGSSFGFSGETTWGFSIGNTLELRGGVRSTTALNVVDDKKGNLGTASWVDGLIMLGFNL